MNLITLIAGAGLIAAAAGGGPAQEEPADFVRKVFGHPLRPTHTLPAVERFLGGYKTAKGSTSMVVARRITGRQIRDQLGDPTTIERTNGEHWTYKLDDGALIRVSMYGPSGPIYQITALDPETKEPMNWIYWAGC